MPNFARYVFEKPNPWRKDEVFHSGDAFVSSLEEAIRHARETIDLETYIYNDDDYGRSLTLLLKEAAERGVRVRVLVDGVGSPVWAIRFLPEMTEAGVEGKVFHPLPWVFWSYSMARRKGFNGLLKLFQKLNQRNHRKVCVVDRKYAWLGSMNISACHLEKIFGRRAWRDTGLRVEGEGVAQLTAAFEKAWRRSRGKQKGVRRAFLRLFKRDRQIHPLVRLNDTRTKRAFYHDDLLDRISQVRRRVWITNAYFVPNGELVRALREAAFAGVDVRIIVPRKSDVFFIRWVAAAFYGGLLESGVRIFEYSPTILHAKTILIDEWACVGSSNLNYRSLLHDLEVDVVVTGKAAHAALEAQFAEDQKNSREVFIPDWKRMSWIERWGGRIALLFKYWL